MLSEALKRLSAMDADGDVILLGLAAVEGDDSLDRALAGNHSGFASRPESEAVTGSESVYLTEIAVEGFRGVGPLSSITFEPQPGLIVVAGRNGSGKSSFADAVEVALTGDSYRWKDKPAEWRDGWRNLHHGTGAAVTARFQTTGHPQGTVVECRWTDDAKKVDDAETWAQHHGEKRTDLAGLGWSQPLDTYRPILSYSELGIITSNPSALHDGLTKVLGLEPLLAASERLRQRALTSERLLKEAKKTLSTSLLPSLDTIDDERGRTAHTALSGRTWDLDAAGAVLGVTPEADGGVSALARMVAPSAEAVADTVTALRTAAARLTALEGSDAAAAARVADLLSRALDVHDHDSPTTCPVCGVGNLDTEWRASTEVEVARLRNEAAEHRSAVQAATVALDRARTLTRPVTIPETDIDVSRLRAAVDRFADLPDDALAAADHLDDVHPQLVAAMQPVVDEARARTSEADELWRPLARQLVAWIEEAREALAAQDDAVRLRAAEKAMKAVTDQVRQDRFSPIADQALELWKQLRLQSNVELTRVDLTGSGTRRRVDLEVKVDDTDGVALGVVSQGEINCLALSLFFPRATLPDSPFRFVVIDDPVQAMDPARVDGLARVFTELAVDRQVIVFTHDDRLPESLRRLGLPHTVLEVTRQKGSVVTVRKTRDPVEQYFSDAWAVAKDMSLADRTATKVVPGICRMGLEAACVEAIRRRRIGRGESHADVERALSDATTMHLKASLALFDDPDQGKKVYPRLDELGPQFANVYRYCNEGAHKGFSGSLTDLVNDAKSLAFRLRKLP